MISLFTPSAWKDYELIDTGDFEKLERFGKYFLCRPEPQAVWDKTLTEKEWKQQADIRFESKTASTGHWIKKDVSLPDRWNVSYPIGATRLMFRLGLTAFKHVGVFPEQSFNWNYIVQILAQISSELHRQDDNVKKSPLRFLNLFAYTGGASLAARAMGAEVTHVDSIKQVLKWAAENQQLSGLSDTRWVLEDAHKFVKREVKRGHTYHGIILDPPAYGNGPNGEKWKLEDQINELLKDTIALLAPEKHFLILNTYSLGFSALIIENLLQNDYTGKGKIEVGELYLQSKTGPKLPLGVIGRIEKLSL